MSLRPSSTPGSGTRSSSAGVELLLRDDENDGVPPRVRVDLNANRVVITNPNRAPETDLLAEHRIK
jgi:hypothetical protein